VLLHRDVELAAIDQALTVLRAGGPAAVVIEGGRGSGKSALLQAALARSQVVALRARCHGAERGFELGVVSQLFDRLPAAELQASAAMGAVAMGTVHHPEHDLLHGFYRVIATIAKTGPVILAIDDIHRADPLSTRWCSYLARRLDNLPVALMLTVDSGDHSADDLIAELGSLTHGRVIRVRPLCQECTGKLLAEMLGAGVDSALAQRCHQLVRGNPQILSALATRLSAAPAHDAPAALAAAAETLADTVLDWLRHDDPVRAQLVEQFAVCRTGTLNTAAMLMGEGEDSAAMARSALRRIGLVDAEPPDRFAHPAMRDAILDRLTPPARARLQIRTASMLSRVGAPAALTAEHMMSVGAISEPWAQPLLRQAAREVAAGGDWSGAARFLSRALLEHGGRAERLTVTAELGAVEFQRDIGACIHRLTVAASLAADDPDLVTALAAFAEPVLTVESGRAAAVFCQSASILAGRAGTDREAVLRLAAQALLSGRTAGAADAIRRLPDKPSDSAARQLLSALALSAGGRGRSRRRCVTLAHRALDADPARGMDRISSTAVCAALALAWAGYLGAAADACAQGIDTAREHASQPGEALGLLVRAEIGYRCGNLAAALADTLAALRLCEAVEATGLRTAAWASLVRVRFARGDSDLAPAQVSHLDPTDSGHPFIVGIALEARGLIAAAHGNQPAALRLYLECGRQLIAGGLANPACSAWRSRAVVTLVGLGRIWEARTLADSEVEMARTWAAPATIGRALTAAASTYDSPARLGLLSEAVQMLEGTGCVLDLARALIGLGTAAGDCGDDGTARAVLTRGLDLAAGCGHARLSETARRALAAAGARPRSQPGSAVLTAGELRVAELVIRGQSNQRVAVALSISKRTVDTHLGRIYRKLGINGRVGLRQALGGPDGS
jgi:DNA-binding CsgD family transcriptional regulator